MSKYNFAQLHYVIEEYKNEDDEKNRPHKATDIINIEEVSQILRLQKGQDVEILESIIDSVVQSFEDFTGKMLLPRKVKATLCNARTKSLESRIAPISKIISVNALDWNYKNIMIDDSKYYVNMRKDRIIFHNEVMTRRLQINYITGFLSKKDMYRFGNSVPELI